ncbi:MAG TPA: FAD-dependent oxidoreductase [Burkholderiaceae bacterium]|nr:FAD-dependent oxidoreductase [Burkholderiaceae bacterium]
MNRVLLAGGGHAHLIAGPRLAAIAPPGTRVALLAPSPRLLYSGMMPGWIAGQYRFDECSIDLRRLALAAGLEWIEDALVDLDVHRREAIGASGRRHPYDLLSLNVGSDAALGEIAPGAAPRVIGAKPFASFVDDWRRWLEVAPPAPRCAVVGGGAAAVEIACALAALCGPGGRLAGGSVTLATRGGRLLPGQSSIAAALALRALAARGVATRTGLRYVGADGDALRFVAEPEAGGALRAAARARVDRRDEAPGGAAHDLVRLSADLAIVATGAGPPAWLGAAARRAGVPVSADGGLSVDACLRSIGDDRLFAAGDCAAFVGLEVPRSGVHALRQGVPLAESIGRRLQDAGGGCAPPARYVPRRRALALLNLCDGTAIGAWGPFGAAGAALWRWKDRIDRRFVEGFADREEGRAV